MGQCYILSKKNFIKQLNELIKDDEAVILSTIKQGRISGATKKRLKSVEIAFNNDCFKNPETVSDLMGSFVSGLILLKKPYWSDEVKKYMDANTPKARIKS